MILRDCLFFQFPLMSKNAHSWGVYMVSWGVWTVSGWCLRVSGICLDVVYVIWIEHSWIGVIIYSYCFFSQCPWIGYIGKEVEIENGRWPYSFSQLDPMLFRVFGPKLTKKSPPGRPPVNSNFGGLPPPPKLDSIRILWTNNLCCMHYWFVESFQVLLSQTSTCFITTTSSFTNHHKILIEFKSFREN